MNEQMAREVGQYLNSEDAKHDRAILVNKSIFWSCVLGAAVFVALYFGSVIYGARAHAADLSYTWPNGNKLVLQMEPCPLGGWFKGWRKAVYQWNGQNVEACWRAQNNPNFGPMVYTVDSQGEVGEVQVGEFKKEEGV